MNRALIGRTNRRLSIWRYVIDISKCRPEIERPIARYRVPATECAASGSKRITPRNAASISSIVTPCLRHFERLPSSQLKPAMDSLTECIRCMYKCPRAIRDRVAAAPSVRVGGNPCQRGICTGFAEFNSVSQCRLSYDPIESGCGQETEWIGKCRERRWTIGMPWQPSLPHAVFLPSGFCPRVRFIGCAEQTAGWLVLAASRSGTGARFCGASA